LEIAGARTFHPPDGKRDSVQRDRIILPHLEERLERTALRIEIVLGESLEPFNGKARPGQEMREMDRSQPDADEGAALSPS